jgi:RNA recognition motif. (a.k.a. RRM, RBD, or RNP domain)
VLSPYPPTTPHTPLPPPSASPRLVKHLPQSYTDSQLYDLFRPYGALASAHTQAGFGKDTGVVEFWREEDARRAEEALHCAEIEGQNIAVQLYQHRRTSGVVSEFSPSAPSFVPSGTSFAAPYPTQVSLLQMTQCFHFHFHSISTLLRGQAHSMLVHPCHLSMARVSKFNLHPSMAQVPTATVVSSIPVTCSVKYAFHNTLLYHRSGVLIFIRTSILRSIQMNFSHIFAR